MRGGRTILHLEDDAAIRRLVSRELESHGYDVISFGDASQLTERLLTSNARVVLLDMDLPENDGLQILRQVRDHDGGVQVVMLTGVASITTVLESMRGGAVACVFKPLDDFGALHAALDSAFERLDYWLKLLDSLRSRSGPAEPSSVV